MRSRKRDVIRWVGFFLAILSVLVVTVAVAAHDDTDGPSCLLCKLGHERVELAAAADTSPAPLIEEGLPRELEGTELTPSRHSLRSRAPPR